MSVIVHEPGTIRQVHYYRGRGPDGKFPVTSWGSVEEQVQEATAAAAQLLAGSRHQPMELFSFIDDCGHQNPEEDERFDDVEDLVADWLERNCLMGVKYPNFDASIPHQQRMVMHDLKYRNSRRAYAVIPLANEWERAQADYDDTHAGQVCLASPQGSVCRGCIEDEDGDPDDSENGFEPSGCVRHIRARERQGEFWWLFSAERAQARAHHPRTS